MLSLGLHVVKAPPPQLGMHRRVAVHLKQHNAEEVVPVLVNRRNVEGGVVLGPEESGKAS